MDKFMIIFQVIFAILIGGAMIKMGFVLKPSEFDTDKHKSHTKA